MRYIYVYIHNIYIIYSVFVVGVYQTLDVQ